VAWAVVVSELVVLAYQAYALRRQLSRQKVTAPSVV